MQNNESATKIDVGSFCNQNLALRHTYPSYLNLFTVYQPHEISQKKLLRHDKCLYGAIALVKHAGACCNGLSTAS